MNLAKWYRIPKILMKIMVNRSVTRVAFGKHFLATSPIFAAMSRVISRDLIARLRGIFSIIAVSALVPAIIATIVPFFLACFVG
jgi:hypothetical protein